MTYLGEILGSVLRLVLFLEHKHLERVRIYLSEIKKYVVTKYEVTFIELTKIALRLVDGVREQVHKFEIWLRIEIRK